MRPSLPFIILIVLWCLTGFPVLFFEEWGWYWAVSGIALMTAGIADGILAVLRRKRDTGIEITRKVPTSTVLNAAVAVSVVITRAHRNGIRNLKLYDRLPPHVEATPYPLRVRLSKMAEGESRTWTVEWRCRRRCRWESGGFNVEYASPAGLFALKTFAAAGVTMTTYPDLGFDSPSEAIEDQRRSAGNVSVRQRGEGTDFKELRDYIAGDPVRRIDWKASSRRRTPVVRSYQEDRDQQILIILDGGYRLHQKEGDGTQFEHALSACLRLARVALEHGDSVGMYTYGREDRWIPPGKGRSWFWRLVRGTYDFESVPAASSPATALEKVLRRLNRRTLLVVVTNLREEDGEMVEWILPLVRGRHLLMTVTLREQGADGPPEVETMEQALEYGAATLYRQQRVRIRRYWEKQGLITLDARPAELTGRMINRYLDMKNSGIL